MPRASVRSAAGAAATYLSALLLLLALIAHGVSGYQRWSPRHHARTVHVGPRHGGRSPLRASPTGGDGGFDSNNGKDVWATRRKLARSTLKPVLKGILEKRKKGTAAATPDTAAAAVSSSTTTSGGKKKKKPVGLVVSAFLIAITAAVLRLGGRSAFVSMLGLDFIAESDIKNQVTDFVTTFTTMEPTVQYGAFFLAWLGAKLLCVDAFTVILALSSGVLFGGIVQGAAVSVACSSTASLIAFLSARYLFREQTENEIEKRPAFRAVERAVAREGFKTVFTLRLSPLLPIPIAMYNYLYGVTSVSPLAFVAGISLGSIKPYLLDSYLGLFGKSLIDDPTGGGPYSDVVLFAFISVLIVVGTFATEVATSTWEEIQAENEEEERKKQAELDAKWSAVGMAPPEKVPGRSDVQGALADSAFFRMMGISAADVDKAPGWAKGIMNDVFAAQSRVEMVIEDELAAVQHELLEGIEVGWDCLPRKAEALKVVAPAAAGDTASADAVVDGVAHLKYAYPGKRNIHDFELLLPDATNFKEYTYESFVFSFALLGAVGKLMDLEDAENDGNDSAAQSVSAAAAKVTTAV